MKNGRGFNMTDHNWKIFEKKRKLKQLKTIYTKWEKWEVEKLKALYSEGFSHKYIAKLLNRKLSTVSNKLFILNSMGGRNEIK